MERQVDAKLGWKHQGYLSIKYSKTGSDRKSKKVAILKVYSVFIFSSEPKGQLTRNFVGSIGVTCILNTENITKIILIRNPR